MTPKRQSQRRTQSSDDDNCYHVNKVEYILTGIYEYTRKLPPLCMQPPAHTSGVRKSYKYKHTDLSIRFVTRHSDNTHSLCLPLVHAATFTIHGISDCRHKGLKKKRENLSNTRRHTKPNNL